jgi:hypothetical protein
MPSLISAAKEWDQVRTSFATSIMVDTSLSSLAQNLDGPDWPLKGPGETPSAYIDLSYDEVAELLALKNQPPERLNQLIDILRDTLAFDDPFGEMVEQGEVSAVADNPLLKNLAKLEIPQDHPIDLTALSPETLEFCALEKLKTLGEFCVFAQGMAQTVIVGGDFRVLLNALSHIDEKEVARILPFRPGAKGLHLVEAVAHTLRPLPASVLKALSQPKPPVPTEVTVRVQRLLQHFKSDAEQVRAQIAAGEPLARIVAVLRDPIIEGAVVSILSPHMPVPPASAKRSWLARLLGR